ncbi:MAG TPA: protein YgfX [Casimicrobiaceae bacterium]
MKSTPVLRVTLRRSRIEAAGIVTLTLATAALLALLSEAIWLRAAAIVLTVIGALYALRHWEQPIVTITVAADRRATLIDRSGRRIDGVVQAESYVGASLTTLVWRPDGARRSCALAIWPDTIAADEFRRLRVLLRHGEARAGSERS